LRDSAPHPPSIGNCTTEEKVLLEKYTPLVRRVAYALQNMRPVLLEQDDVMQDGMIGLLRAIRTNRGTPTEAQFSSFANISIRGAIIDGYRAAGEIPRNEYDQAKKIRLAIDNGEPVSASDRSRAELIFRSAWTPSLQIEGEPEDSLYITDPQPGPEQRAISNQLLRIAVDVLQALPVRDRTIFIRCELQGEKHSAVARKFDISGGRVSQILKDIRQHILLALA